MANGLPFRLSDAEEIERSFDQLWTMIQQHKRLFTQSPDEFHQWLSILHTQYLNAARWHQLRYAVNASDVDFRELRRNTMLALAVKNMMSALRNER